MKDKKIKGFEKAEAAYQTLNENEVNGVEEINHQTGTIANDLVSFLDGKGFDVLYSNSMNVDLGDILKGDFNEQDLLVSHKFIIEGEFDAVLFLDYSNTIANNLNKPNDKLSALLLEFKIITGHNMDIPLILTTQFRRNVTRDSASN